MWPGLPALVVSAYGDEGNHASAMDRGAPGLAVEPVNVVKPVDFDGQRGAMADRTKVVWLERAKSSRLAALRNSLNSLPSPRRQSNSRC